MPRTGRPPIPTEVKRRRGTFRADQTRGNLAVLPAVDVKQLVDGPIIEVLVTSGAAGWVGATDAPTVRLAQRLWDDMELLRAALDLAFDKDTHAAYMATIRELRTCLSMLGLSPSDRSRLGVAEVKARSKLEELMDRRSRASARRSQPPPSGPETETTS